MRIQKFYLIFLPAIVLLSAGASAASDQDVSVMGSYVDAQDITSNVVNAWNAIHHRTSSLNQSLNNNLVYAIPVLSIAGLYLCYKYAAEKALRAKYEKEACALREQLEKKVSEEEKQKRENEEKRCQEEEERRKKRERGIEGSDALPLPYRPVPEHVVQSEPVIPNVSPDDVTWQTQSRNERVQFERSLDDMQRKMQEESAASMRRLQEMQEGLLQAQRDKDTKKIEELRAEHRQKEEQLRKGQGQ